MEKRFISKQTGRVKCCDNMFNIADVRIKQIAHALARTTIAVVSAEMF